AIEGQRLRPNEEERVNLFIRITTSRGIPLTYFSLKSDTHFKQSQDIETACLVLDRLPKIARYGTVQIKIDGLDSCLTNELWRMAERMQADYSIFTEFNTSPACALSFIEGMMVRTGKLHLNFTCSVISEEDLETIRNVI
ncbi:hypothetical protein PFISCL1PPCAC_18901, partial [Pristionchus fissidentatus]